MSVFYKCEPKGAVRKSDRARLRAKTDGLLKYILRGDIQALKLVGIGRTLNEYHASLLRYVQRHEQAEEVAASLTRNILSEDPDLMTAELEALREDSNVGDAAVEHYIISVRPDEPLLENFDETVDVFTKFMGIERCPCVAAVHLDTDNPHIHLVVLRVDVDTGARSSSRAMIESWPSDLGSSRR